LRRQPFQVRVTHARLTMKTTTLFCLPALWAVAQCYAVPLAQQANDTTTKRRSGLHRRDTDPTDFSWVKRWAAVGDSYTAGIGSGSPLGNFNTEKPGETDWYCARYDTSYPMIVNDALGPSVENFQFAACSGDRTGGVYNQIVALEGNLDLVMLTAGGNDLCLVSTRIMSLRARALIVRRENCSRSVSFCLLGTRPATMFSQSLRTI
jgi:lysophospholipase L1-like esterase